MAISNFISTIWSETLIHKLNGKYVGVANCTREWEGDIKKKGDRVKICGVGPVTVVDYTKNTNLSGPSTLNDFARELVISQAKAFNFQVDDIDRAQGSPKIMEEALHNAAIALAKEADTYVYSLYSGIDEDNTITVASVSADNILSNVLAGVKMLHEAGVTDEIVLEVSPTIANIIFNAKLSLATDNSELLENGCIGSLAGCKVFVSNNISATTSSGTKYHKCFMRTKRAIAFAEQLSEIEAYRPELRFADAMKGLMLYGAKIVYPAELILLDLGVAA